MLKKVFGIVSWFPDINPDRQQRLARFNRLLDQLKTLWPDVPVMIIAQNWHGCKLNYSVDNLYEYEKALGILGARKMLRKKFLESEYDYLIMLDDDAIIQCDTASAASDYIKSIDEHPDGFCFIKGSHNVLNPYADSQLNLCAISKAIYAKEDMVNIDATKGDGYEDRIFSYLLHVKYAKNEFDVLPNIRCIHFKNMQEKVVSTWANGEHRDWSSYSRKTLEIEKYIQEHGDLPDSLRKK